MIHLKKIDKKKLASIVLMKSPHHLTDQFIPGYFGHVGISPGNELAAKLKNSDHQTQKSESPIKCRRYCELT